MISPQADPLTSVAPDHASILREFEEARAIEHGHFILSSGLHSPTYVQCARVLVEPDRAERLCRALIARCRTAWPDRAVDYIVSPALGGVVVGYEVARQMGIPFIFCERSQGMMSLRRGFEIPQGTSYVLVEDVITTGKSSLEVRDCLAARDPSLRMVGALCLVNRSGKDHLDEVPLIALLPLTIPSYPADQVPPALAAIAPYAPGSRWTAAAATSLNPSKGHA